MPYDRNQKLPIDNLIPQSYTVGMKPSAKHEKQPATEATGGDSLWVKSPVANLVRYKPSGTYFVRAKVGGKFFLQSLKTDVLSVAKLRLNDKLAEKRKAAEKLKTSQRGEMTFGQAIAQYLKHIDANSDIKPSTKKYRHETTDELLKSWPGIRDLNVRKITVADCQEWRTKFAQSYSATRVNGTITTLKQILDIPLELGILYQNPARQIKRARERRKHYELPTTEQFDRFLVELDNAGGRFSKHCGNLVRFLAYGGFRIAEVAHITWGNCDFKKGEIFVRGDADTGTKNWESRRVPMIPPMKALLKELRGERSTEPSTSLVMEIRECQKAMTRAASKVGMPRITHHGLRHLFATRCIESGVDIPTVSRWLGHKDGGALAMKVYGHLRDQHSAEMASKVSFSVPAATVNAPHN